MRPYRISILASVFFLLSGCAGLNFKSEPLVFDDPALILKVTEVTPNIEEQEGILLRLRVPEKQETHGEESLKIYSQLHDNKGMSLNLRQKSVTTYKPVEGRDSFLQRTIMTFEGEAGQITDESEISPRGEIVRFVEGHHDSKVGKFRIANASRTPVYPEGRVKIGDTWNFKETMDARLESAWIKEQNPTPYDRQAENKLTGFAIVGGRRCAVIKTLSTQIKKETVKVLFKTITAEIQATMEETDYFDYQAGILVAKVTQTRSHSIFPGTNLEDHGMSQAIYRLLE